MMQGPLNVKVYFVLVFNISPLLYTNVYVPSPSVVVVTSYSALCTVHMSSAMLTGEQHFAGP